MAIKHLHANFSKTECNDQITLNEHVSQWDVGWKLSVSLNGSELPMDNNFKPDPSGVMVHFANKYSEKALVVNNVDGWISTGDPSKPEEFSYIVDFDIPNSLLEQDAPIFVYVVLNKSSESKFTMKTAVIIVDPRKQPNDYISKQDYVYTLEALRAEMIAIIKSYENDRNADYQNFKEDIKQDVQNIVIKQTRPEVKSYSYLTNTSVEYNGVTYTVTKDSTTGLINKISANTGFTFSPTINTGITDVMLHNAVFWATAMTSLNTEAKYTGMTIIPNVLEGEVATAMLSF